LLARAHELFNRLAYILGSIPQYDNNLKRPTLVLINIFYFILILINVKHAQLVSQTSRLELFEWIEPNSISQLGNLTSRALTGRLSRVPCIFGPVWDRVGNAFEQKNPAKRVAANARSTDARG